jgi:hypothetical protein
MAGFFDDKNVRYHCGGWSEEVNSRILFLSYMVNLHSYQAIIIYTHTSWQSFRQLQAITMYIYRLQYMWCDPLAFCFPLLTSFCSPFYSPLLT